MSASTWLGQLPWCMKARCFHTLPPSPSTLVSGEVWERKETRRQRNGEEKLQVCAAPLPAPFLLNAS